MDDNYTKEGRAALLATKQAQEAQEALEARRELLEQQKQELRRQGTLEGKIYTKLETREVKDASSFFLLSAYKVAIPVCSTSNDSYQLYVQTLGPDAWSLPEDICGLPTIQTPAFAVLCSDWRVLPVLVECLVTKPMECLSPSLREAIREARKRSLASRARKIYITGEIDLNF